MVGLNFLLFLILLSAILEKKDEKVLPARRIENHLIKKMHLKRATLIFNPKIG
jgi:hypothetical protein